LFVRTRVERRGVARRQFISIDVSSIHKSLQDLKEG